MADHPIPTSYIHKRVQRQRAIATYAGAIAPVAVAHGDD
jgi:hypothetical protein